MRRLDRIAGSEKMAIETIDELHERGVNITSSTEPDIDTSTPMGRALSGIVAVFAQLRATVPRAFVPCTDAVAALSASRCRRPASAWPLRARWMGPDAGSSGPSTPGPR